MEAIYIDIKFKCNEKLIYFLDKEYYVRDRNTSSITGIYQAFMIHKKNNTILKNV